MNGLKVAFDKFTGSGFQAFVTFAKQKLREGKGIVAVTYLQGYGDADYGALRCGWVGCCLAVGRSAASGAT